MLMRDNEVLMSTGNSRVITSNQEDIHPDLAYWVDKYQQSEFKRPIAKHTQDAFDAIQKRIAGLSCPIVLDSGCGVGMSTIILAKQHPECFVVGVDQSAVRLEKNPCYLDGKAPDNYQLIQADCVDFWRLAKQADWQIKKHYIFYPNPWPKKSHLKRRWHGHPVFAQMCDLSTDIELRTNWDIYAKEFHWAWQYITGNSADLNIIEPDSYITPFEKKYYLSGQQLYQVVAEKNII